MEVDDSSGIKYLPMLIWQYMRTAALVDVASYGSRSSRMAVKRVRAERRAVCGIDGVHEKDVKGHLASQAHLTGEVTRVSERNVRMRRRSDLVAFINQRSNMLYMYVYISMYNQIYDHA